MEEDEGGSSQDEYESDFINDGKEDFVDSKVATNKKGKKVYEAPKLHSSEEEYYTKSLATNSEDEDKSWEDPYDKLPLADDQKEGGFKYHSKEKCYYLKGDGFHLTSDIYENLFPH